MRRVKESEEVWHEIITEDSHPVRQAPQCVPFALKSEVSKLVGDMLGNKVIEESCCP